MSWTEAREAMLMAFGSLRSNKFRAGLTILGVMIGVCSVITFASVINGLNGALNEQIDSWGGNSIYITKLPFNVDWDELSEEDRNRPAITEGEARAILDNCPAISGVAPQNFYFKPGGNEVKYGSNKASRPNLFGTWPAYPRVVNQEMSEGRFFSDMEENSRAAVCVIGSKVSSALFEGGSAVGKEIRINGNLFLVIGVFEEKKANFDEGDGDNNAVAIPLSTFSKLHPWEEELFLIAQAESKEKMETAKEEIINALRVYRQVPFNKVNNFHLSTQDTVKDMVANFTKWIYIGMMVITSVGLMVGGIGVMNIMLVSVTERTREIGIRKAVGAKKANIIFQFLTEAITLSGTGGVVGIVVGVILGVSINALIGFPLGISLFWIIIGFTVAVSVGLVSGLYPAYRAANLDPIESLRYE